MHTDTSRSAPPPWARSQSVSRGSKSAQYRPPGTSTVVPGPGGRLQVPVGHQGQSTARTDGRPGGRHGADGVRVPAGEVAHRGEHLHRAGHVKALDAVVEEDEQVARR